MKRNPALDGLRAIAVGVVVLFHTSPAAQGGFVGVDIFFVISGFLITTLLLAEVGRTGRIDLRAFWVRRALRLLPALLLMVALTVPLMLTTLREVAAWAGLAGLAVCVAVLQPFGGATYLGGLFAVGVCTLLVVHHLAVSDSGPLVRLLSLRPLVVVGTLSYGIYLFHLPVFQAVQHAHPPRLLQHALEVGLTAVLVVFSYVVVERPALRLKHRFTVPGPADLPPPGRHAAA